MKQIILITSIFMLSIFTACSQDKFESVNTVQFDSLIKNNSVRLIDVRTPDEFSEGHINGAVNIDVSASDFVAKAENMDKKQPIAVYCRSGKRSQNAARILSDKGFKVYNLSGGILSWEKNGMPVVK